ncbi:MAG: hypothetical protein ACTSRI_17220 [Promethearchaeota archaeon]
MTSKQYGNIKNERFRDMIGCENNKSALSLAGYKVRKIRKRIMGNFETMNKWTKFLIFIILYSSL